MAARSGPGGNAALIQDGAAEFLLYAELGSAESVRKLGVQAGAGGMSIHVDGEAGASVADLAAAFPVQVIEPEIHELVQGGPKGRRRFIDWGVFHVKHGFYPVWRRYRRALQQRNHALRQTLPKAAVCAWDRELLAAGGEIDALRRDYLDSLQADFARISSDLVGQRGSTRYRRGWTQDQDFELRHWRRPGNATRNTAARTSGRIALN